MISQIFQIDSKFWTITQEDQIDEFFITNKFYSKFYKHQFFNKVIEITFYHKLSKNSSLLLQNQRKPQVIILLSGKIKVSKKKEPHSINTRLNNYYSLINNITNFNNNRRVNRKSLISLNSESSNYEDLYVLSQQNQTFTMDTQCKITSLSDQQSQILYIPSNLYQNFIQIINQQLIQKLYTDLRRYFPYIQRKFLINLAKSSCSYKQYKINNTIYKIGDTPSEVYLLIDGKVKMDNFNGIDKRLFDTIIIHQNVIFGDKDILFQKRIKNATVVSSSVKLLIIQKNQFLKFARQFLPQMQFSQKASNFQLLSRSQFHLPNVKTRINSNTTLLFNKQRKKPNSLSQLQSIGYFQTDHKIQTLLFKNSHILSDLSPRINNSSSKLSLKNYTQQYDFSKDQFEQKLKLYNKRRPNNKQVNIQNPLFDWSNIKNNNLTKNNNSPLSSSKHSYWKDQIKNL